jgi:hypothetical protein
MPGTMMTKSPAPWLLALVCAVGCGDDDGGLDIDEVTNLPPGDADGDAASGTWTFEAYTSACAGVCSAGGGVLTAIFCEVGNRDNASAMVTQDDGALQIDVDDSFFVSRLKGGVDADGAFDVGGYGTENGGALGITARLVGAFEGDAAEGTAELRIVGEAYDDRIDCRASYDVTGTR